MIHHWGCRSLTAILLLRFGTDPDESGWRDEKVGNRPLTGFFEPQLMALKRSLLPKQAIKSTRRRIKAPYRSPPPELCWLPFHECGGGCGRRLGCVSSSFTQVMDLNALMVFFVSEEDKWFNNHTTKPRERASSDLDSWLLKRILVLLPGESHLALFSGALRLGWSCS